MCATYLPHWLNVPPLPTSPHPHPTQRTHTRLNNHEDMLGTRNTKIISRYIFIGKCHAHCHYITSSVQWTWIAVRISLQRWCHCPLCGRYIKLHVTINQRASVSASVNRCHGQFNKADRKIYSKVFPDRKKRAKLIKRPDRSNRESDIFIWYTSIPSMCWSLLW